MPDDPKAVARRELINFLYLFLTGIVLLPLSIYVVGHLIFGEYGGTGFSAFYGALHSALRSGDPAVWFLVLAPYLIWQTLRLTILVYSKVAARRS